MLFDPSTLEFKTCDIITTRGFGVICTKYIDVLYYSKMVRENEDNSRTLLNQ